MIEPAIAFHGPSFSMGIALGAVIGALLLLAILWPAVLCRDYANDPDPTEDGRRPL